jgi:hypothetical protein
MALKVNTLAGPTNDFFDFLGCLISLKSLSKQAAFQRKDFFSTLFSPPDMPSNRAVDTLQPGSAGLQPCE